MKKIILVAFATILSVNILAQKKISFNADVAYLFGLQERTDYGNFSRSDFDMSGASLHLSALYKISDSFSAGAGIGLDRYDHPGYNTLPIFLKANYSPLKSCRELYLFSDLGRCIGTSDFIKGTMLDAGFGYKINLKNNWRINFKLGYNVNWAEGKNKTIIPNDVDFQYVSFDEIDHTRHSLFIGLGIEF